MRGTERLLDRIEREERLDTIADGVSGFWSSTLRSERLRDVLCGRMLGHPLHPAAILVPAGTLLSATLLDTTGGASLRPAARRLIGLGLLSAGPAALAGWSDWLDTTGAERRVGLVHAASNIVGIASYAVSWNQRRRGARGLAASVTGAAALGIGGWLGGHLAYAQGVGVDTTAFQRGPADWTDVLAASEVTLEPRKVEIDGVPVLLTRVDGQIVAISDRCTHRGGPLHEGDRVGGCVRCPWHGSRFELESGEVVRGPATRPQPLYEVREIAGRVQIRRPEVRALRANPVGPSAGPHEARPRVTAEGHAVAAADRPRQHV
ncbi:Ferredoxin subunit of nitrite reductase or a ring-hydroxylating dioxygenase [Parafrankia irregularis]|uniref:Ferredoxin subunit of nitrite reductase or a ring-hydroxylating dioxygenase n=1 Tax=Parafrankia irregularis TaxID=795642 RepID=A0A0S4R0F8_9ACTN|nr:MULTISPECIES: Rieske 2Fe-2S domain-containing protein [Parafrankia]MBE3200675.1 Rieske 2Fe-2S domain-containing protein [Parafrankia sp. CH37]CUU60504.1 Ferredoxin subunit of nitrite reductase or a ring-hydroxylating dioxygenase [Parafrankia irregularis]